MDLEAERRVLRYQLGERLLELRGGDVSRMVNRLVAVGHRGGLVALRDRGSEVMMIERTGATDPIGDCLAVHDLKRSGHMPRIEVLWWGEDLEAWLEAHHDELDWVHPCVRK
ncbi:hypothetical protein ACLI4Q_15150 [Natrialbaceae archaeon A-CW1-1]